MVMRKMEGGRSIPNVEVGYAIVRGDDHFSVGVDAATKAMESVAEHALSVLLVHVRGDEGLPEVLAGISSIVDDAPVIGIVSEISPARGIEVSAVAIASPFLTLSIGIGSELSENWSKALKNAMKSDELTKYFGESREENWHSLVDVGRSAFGMVLTTEPEVGEPVDITSVLSELLSMSDNRIPFTGGSTLNISGDRTSSIIYNQEIHTDGLLVAVIETNLRIGTSMAHGFSSTEKKLTVTKVQGRTILELDGHPAEEELGKYGTIESINIGRVGAYGSIRHLLIEEVTPEGILISENLSKGTVLTILEPEGNDLEEAGFEAFNKALIRGSIEEPVLCLVFSSVYRRKMLGNQAANDIEMVRPSRPGMYIVGFDTGGEIGLTDEGANRYNHKTVSVLVLGQKLSYAAEVANQNKQLLGKLVIAEASQRTLLDLMPDAILATNKALKITHWNPQTQKLLGHEKESVLGLSVTEILHPRLRWTLENAAHQLLESGESSTSSFDAEVFRSDQSIVPVEVTLSFNPHEERYSFVIVFHDITEHKTLETILDRERRAYKSIAEAAINAPTIEDLCNQTLEGIMSTLGYDIGTFRLYDEERQVLVLTACIGIDSDTLEKELYVRPFEESGYLGTESAFSMQAVFSPNVREDPNLVGKDERIGRLGIEATVIWPVKSSTGDLLGILNIAAYTPKDDTEESRMFFEVLADMFATVIERRLTQEALSESESKVRTILQSMRDMVFVFDEDDQYIEAYYSDPSLVYGDPEEFMGKHLSEALPPSVADSLIRTAKRVRETKQPETLDYSLNIEGRTLWFSANISLHEDGKSIVSVSRDITARKDAEIALARRLEYEKALANISQSLLLSKEEIGGSLNYALDTLRKVTDASRVYIFENVVDKELGHSTRVMTESVQEGIEKEEDMYPGRLTAYRDGYSRWSKELSEGRYIVGLVEELPEQEQKKLLELGVKAILVIPLWVQDHWFGYIGFDDTKIKRHWTIDEIRLLRTAAEMISGYLVRQSTDAELKSSVRDLELYSSILRHDFANDIMRILNQIEAAEILGIDEQQLREIMKTSKVAAESMNQVLSVFQTESQKSRNRVRDLLEDVIEQAKKAHPSLTISLKLDEAAAAAEIAGGRLLPMVFSNLMRNAEDYAGVAANVSITARLLDREIEFVISDDGPGVDKSIRDRLFQAGASTTGGGLGLYLCKRVVVGYRGSMEYIKSNSSGAAFRIILPLAR
ncbi:MAG: PAS domain S-box protein [Candidatus Thorarchaeota archaeon]